MSENPFEPYISIQERHSRALQDIEDLRAQLAEREAHAAELWWVLHECRQRISTAVFPGAEMHRRISLALEPGSGAKALAVLLAARVVVAEWHKGLAEPGTRNLMAQDNAIEALDKRLQEMDK